MLISVACIVISNKGENTVVDVGNINTFRVVRMPITTITQLKPKATATKTPVIDSLPLNKTALVRTAKEN